MISSAHVLTHASVRTAELVSMACPSVVRGRIVIIWRMQAAAFMAYMCERKNTHAATM